MSRSGQIRLIVPEVVLQELSRQWSERLMESATATMQGLKGVNEALEDAGVEKITIDLPEFNRSHFYGYAKRTLIGKGTEIAEAPDVALADLLARDMDVRKPFNREGKGFRDALIWETIRDLCGSIGDPTVPVYFVTNNHSDFCAGRSGLLHPDLVAELPAGQLFDVVPDLQVLRNLPEFQALTATHRALQNFFTASLLEELIDVPISELHGQEVEAAVGVYIGSGMTEVRVSSALEGAAFDEIIVDQETVDHEILHDGNDLTLSVTFEADCSFDGYVDKGDYLIADGEGVTVLEDWNDHMFRAATGGRVRFVLSGGFTENTVDDLVLTVDEAEDA
jgi:hypothetical protein